MPLEQHFIGVKGKPNSPTAKKNLDKVVYEKVSELVNEGHQVGTHTYAHEDLALVDEYGILDQLLFNEQAIVQALGRIPTYFRPPYFSTNDDVLDTVGELGYHVINAGVDTNDWKGDYDAARQAFSQVLTRARSKSPFSSRAERRSCLLVASSLANWTL